MSALALFSVLVRARHDAGPELLYLVEAPDSIGAALVARTIYDAHSSNGGEIVVVIAGEVRLHPYSESMPTPAVVDLRAGAYVR